MTSPSEQGVPRSLAGRPLVLTLFVAAVVALAGGFYLASARGVLRRAAGDDLAAVAEMKRADVAAWFHERWGDARAFSAAGIGENEIAAALSHPDPSTRATVRSWLAVVQSTYGYAAVVLYREDGTVMLSSGEHVTPVRPESLRRAVREHDVVLEDFSAADASGRRQVTFLAPVFVREAPGQAATVVVVALVVDARRDLYPMLRTWPFRVQSVETILARRDNDRIVYLTDPALSGDQRGLYQVPLQGSSLALAGGLQGANGPFSGLDYAGARVLAAGGPVQGTPWFLMVKQHLDEVDEPFWITVRITSAFAVLIIVTAAFGVMNAARRQSLRALHARLAIERERQDSAERLRSALSASPDPFVVLDDAGLVLEWNQRAELTFGWPRADALGQRFTALTLAPPHDAQYEAAIAAARRGELDERLNTVGTVVARGRDGRIFQAEVTFVPVRVQAELLFSVVIRDITARVRAQQEISVAQAEAARLLREAEDARRALLNIIDDQRRTEEALRESEAQLETRVARRTQQLEAANRELEAFSYSVSHDLRAPLRAIAGYARMLDEDYGTALDPEGRRRLEVVQREAARMGTLIDDLLRFSRAGRQPLQQRVVDMTALARETLDEVQRQHPGRTVRATLDDVPPAMGDPGVLRQVWANLIGNAFKFTAPRPDATIEIGGRSGASTVRYYVRDNGVGFDMRYADKLFGVFQRLHTSAEFEGTGVGLALVQRIVARHGGEVWAEAEVGRGATFWFSLPSGGTADEI
ncbi:MAG: PAS domain S-box protein [Acidobacteria bacterium]|nr:PAS domain S-box protein [Acidobacteriota bacterium]